jgi:hypothetical protein
MPETERIYFQAECAAMGSQMHHRKISGITGAPPIAIAQQSSCRAMVNSLQGYCLAIIGKLIA